MSRYRPITAFDPRIAAGVALAALLLAPPAAAQGTGAVAGRVRDAATGQTVAGVEVWLWPASDPGVVLASVRTAGGGRYRIDGLEPGDYYLNALTSRGYLGELPDGTPCYFGLRFTPPLGFDCDDRHLVPPSTTVVAGATVEVSFDLDLGGVIAGRVTAAATGEAVRAAVNVKPDFGPGNTTSVTTYGNGRYQFRALPAGNYWVSTFNRSGFVDEVHAGTIARAALPETPSATFTVGPAPWSRWPCAGRWRSISHSNGGA